MSKTLLLADDSVVIQKLVGLSFANEDIEILSTDNGDDAVLRAQEVRPDVVLADVVMPGKSGYEVCEAIKQNPALAHIPVLLLTGTFEAFDEGRANAAGADGHITKPFEAQALVERVKTVLRNAARPAPAPSRNETSARGLSMPSADDLFSEPVVPAKTSAAGSFFGRTDSLDVTPSVGLADLEAPLETDFFGDANEELGATSFSASIAPLPPIVAPVDASRPVTETPLSTSFAAPLATPAALSTPAAPPAPAHAPIAPFPSTAQPPLDADDLGFDEPLDIASIPPQDLEFDPAFDPGFDSGFDSASRRAGSAESARPAPASLPASLPPSLPPIARTARESDVVDDATTGGGETSSLAPFVAVTDLDEILAEPLGEDASFTLDRRADRLPKAADALTLAPEARSADDLDFGFDVSEQATIAKVDLLEESFSSLLDVSESQLLADPPARPLPVAAPSAPATPAIPGTQSEADDFLSADFDVSSSDLAKSASRPVLPLEMPREMPLAAPVAAPAPPPIPSPGDSGFALELDVVAHEPPAAPLSPPSFATRSTPTPTSAPTSTPPPIPTSSARAAGTAPLMSPLLEQHVQETLEKVAWEAFSDLSETIVKQVMERVERIAWEVIPQMAETLVREEIRKMKGEED